MQGAEVDGDWEGWGAFGDDLQLKVNPCPPTFIKTNVLNDKILALL